MGRFVGGFLSAFGLPPADAARLHLARPVPLGGHLPTAELAADAVGAMALAADAAHAARTGSAPEGRISLDPDRIAASFRSDQLGRLGGEPFPAWAPLSGFFPAADGWVRTHANYAWHAAALARVLGVVGSDRAGAAAAIRERSARHLEDEVYAAGGLAVAMRSVPEWAAERRGAAGAVGDRAPVPVPVRVRARDAAKTGRGRGGERAGTRAAPLAGVRVLDLTRVIAGPVGTRALAALGADVLRVDAPGRPEPLWQWLDTGRGKRSTLLDLAATPDFARLRELLAAADVVVCSSRPGALRRFGLEPEQIAADFPGVVNARVVAWGAGGEWGDRRGFDSLVQAATGIALRESPDGVVPGKLPAQALDHSAGALLAGGVMSLLARGTGGEVETVLEGIAQLLGSGTAVADRAPIPPGPDAVPPALATAPSQWGALAIAGPAYWPSWRPTPGPWAGRPWGEDPPVWLGA
ncbi:CoA transferase [Leucobacter luti]|uniref:CoA transferase family III n=1 Tax=Leucobacter luti TaxID=340320 RepID=A0A4Q7U128_9MICO|nr:CoA transferase [Leucobacter luti]MBL3699609.1 hypothetical protein [Leucobacter luti]RZT67121.1 CoA transferase family III [Leucobacter luti]